MKNSSSGRKVDKAVEEYVKNREESIMSFRLYMGELHVKGDKFSEEALSGSNMENLMDKLKEIFENSQESLDNNFEETEDVNNEIVLPPLFAEINSKSWTAIKVRKLTELYFKILGYEKGGEFQFMKSEFEPTWWNTEEIGIPWEEYICPSYGKKDVNTNIIKILRATYKTMDSSEGKEKEDNPEAVSPSSEKSKQKEGNKNINMKRNKVPKKKKDATSESSDENGDVLCEASDNDNGENSESDDDQLDDVVERKNKQTKKENKARDKAIVNDVNKDVQINIASSSYAQIREKNIREQKELLAAANRAYEQQGTSKRGSSLSSIKLVKQRSIKKKNK